MHLNGVTLRKIRIAYGLTQADMGALLDCTAGMVNKIERGKYPMTDNIRKAINRELNLTPEKVEALLAEYDRIMKRKEGAKMRKGTAV